VEPSFSPAPPGFPRRFGAYLLLSPIAQGGMGDVFLASTVGVAGAVRLVVIKTLRQDLAMEDGYTNRFLDEARVVIQLQHPNISQVFDVGCIDGTHYFAMEHILGTNLRRLLDLLGKAKGRVPVPIAMFIAAEMLDGLDCAHQHRHALTNEPLRVVHRDVSPHNIMISLNGEVKVIDFGLAESALKVEQTETKVVLGKIAYMPPEQARGEELDASADQFAAAVVLYEMVTGERFYGERTQPQIWAIAGHPGFLPDRIGDIEPDLAAILRRGLASHPNERFPTCGAFAKKLRALLNDRYLETSRATLRDFVRQSAARELENSEKNVRALSELALRTTPELVSSRAPSNDVVDADTGATATSLIVRPAKKQRGWVAAGVVLASAIIAVVAFVVTRDVEPPPAVVAAPVPVVVVVDAGTAVVEEVEPLEEVVEEAKPRVKRAVKKPVWTSWTLAKKVKALESCSKPCALTVKNVIAKGGDVKQPIVDVCLPQCGVR
jgi:serine/threonine protein kinase